MEALWLLGVFLGGVAVGIVIAVDNRRLDDWMDDWKPTPVTDRLTNATPLEVQVGGNASFPYDAPIGDLLDAAARVRRERQEWVDAAPDGVDRHLLDDLLETVDS